MAAKLKLKKRDYTLKEENDVYISKIGHIVGKVKGVIFEVEIQDFRIFEFDDTMLATMNVADDTGSIMAFLIGNRDDGTKAVFKKIVKGERYQMRGNVVVMDEEMVEIYQEMVSIPSKELLGQKAFFLLAFSKLNEK
ncbi:MAG: hypothetical protein K2M17_03175 [Bacilli bacterium]|nr:hypothetical protein [Bacilli bacterium]